MIEIKFDTPQKVKVGTVTWKKEGDHFSQTCSIMYDTLREVYSCELLLPGIDFTNLETLQERIREKLQEPTPSEKIREEYQEYLRMINQEKKNRGVL